MTETPRGAGRSDAGMSLLETVVALGILLVVLLGILPLAVLALTTTENEGHLVARATEYAQDKMEQLFILSFSDTSTDTRLFPSPNVGGTGLAIGGSANPAAPAAGYVDYLDVSGNLLASTGTTAPTGWFYRRVWSVTSAGANLKQITVTAIVRSSVGRRGRIPQATLVALKTSPF
jgi:hypothetical protein